MKRRSRQLLTVLFAAGYLVQTMLLGVIHFHAGSDCSGHCDTAQTASAEESTCWWLPTEHQHHDCCQAETFACHNHEHRAPQEAPRRPHHDRDNCSICQHLTQRTVSVQYVNLVDTGELIEPVEIQAPESYFAAPLLLHHSRGPPSTSC